MRYSQLRKRERANAHRLYQRGQIDRRTFGAILNGPAHITPTGKVEKWNFRLWRWETVGRIYPQGTFTHKTAPKAQKKQRTAPLIAQ